MVVSCTMPGVHERLWPKFIDGIALGSADGDDVASNEATLLPHDGMP